MQILQWLFKTAAEEPPKLASNSSPITPKQDQNAKSRDIVVVVSTDGGVRRRRLKTVEESKLNCENLSLLRFLQRKDVSRPFFYRTLNLKRLGSFHRRRHSVHSVKMTKEVVARGLSIPDKADSTAHGGNKVLPVTDNSAQSSSGSGGNQCPDSDKKEKIKGDKTKTISRMKDLMKWAASAKKGGKYGIARKVLTIKKRAASKAVHDDDQLSNESPKISFRWETESCSTTCSAYSTISAVSSSLKNGKVQSADTLNSTTALHRCAADGTGNWITTDSEFVVLEL